MSATRSRRTGPRDRGTPLRVAAAVTAAVVAFAVGIALGQALEEDSPPAGTQTLVRTLNPLPLPPAARETVTVTNSEP